MGNSNSGRGGLAPHLVARAARLFALGLGYCQVAKRVGIDPKTARKTMRHRAAALRAHDRCPTCGGKLLTKFCIACRATGSQLRRGGGHQAA